MRHRVLIVDDSSTCRSALRTLLRTDPEMQVVGEAADGVEVTAHFDAWRPTLVLLDLHMPRMGGLETIEWIMAHRPTAIVVVTDRPASAGVDQTFAALSRGALELWPKSAAWLEGISEARPLIARLKQLALQPLRAPAPVSRPAPADETLAVLRQRPAGWAPYVVGVGASTGGPTALLELLVGLPASFPLPVVVVQHMDELFQESFVAWLARRSPLPIALARDGEALRPGTVTVAPSGTELLVRPGGVVELVPPPPAALHAPSVDQLFFSLAESYGSGAVGVLLTGMGSDGAGGLGAMKARGALTLAQEGSSCVIYGMPRAAVELGAVAASAPPATLARLVAESARPPPRRPPTNSRSLSTGRNAKEELAMATRAKILLVDDSPVVIEAGRMLLEDAGYEVLSIDNPLSVAAVMRRENPDLVLIDLNMPAVSGDVVTRIVKQHELVRKTPVVLYSDTPEEELRRRAEACGASGFIRKDGDEEGFLAAVRSYLPS